MRSAPSGERCVRETLDTLGPPDVTIGHIYRGIIPFVLLQIVGLVIVFEFPKIVTWLPAVAYAN